MFCGCIAALAVEARGKGIVYWLPPNVQTETNDIYFGDSHCSFPSVTIRDSFDFRLVALSADGRRRFEPQFASAIGIFSPFRRGSIWAFGAALIVLALLRRQNRISGRMVNALMLLSGVLLVIIVLARWSVPAPEKLEVPVHPWQKEAVARWFEPPVE